MNALTVLTPVIRPENLARVGASLARGRELFDLRWWVVRDQVGGCPVIPESAAYRVFTSTTPTSPMAYGRTGEWVLNTILPSLRQESGWAWALADDNLASPAFFEDLDRLLRTEPEADFIVYPQLHDGIHLRAARENVKFRCIDGGQFVYATALIGNSTFAPTIAPDSDFAEDLLHHAKHPVFRPHPVLPYNALRPRDPR